MLFDNKIVPGGEWVEITQITNLDGIPIAEDNWRHKLIGRVTLCWIAGGFHCRGAFFMGHLRIVNGVVLVVNRHSARWCSTTTAQPVEVEPGIFDFKTNTSIYRFRVLSDMEAELVHAAIRKQVLAEMKACGNIPFSAEDSTIS